MKALTSNGAKDSRLMGLWCSSLKSGHALAGEYLLFCVVTLRCAHFYMWPESDLAVSQSIFIFFCLVISSLCGMGGADQNWVTWSVYCNSSSSHSSFQKDVMSFLDMAADRIKHMGRLKQPEVKFALLRRRQWRSNDTDTEYFCQLHLSVF